MTAGLGFATALTMFLSFSASIVPVLKAYCHQQWFITT